MTRRREDGGGSKIQQSDVKTEILQEGEVSVCCPNIPRLFVMDIGFVHIIRKFRGPPRNSTATKKKSKKKKKEPKTSRGGINSSPPPKEQRLNKEAMTPETAATETSPTKERSHSHDEMTFLPSVLENHPSGGPIEEHDLGTVLGLIPIVTTPENGASTETSNQEEEGESQYEFIDLHNMQRKPPSSNRKYLHSSGPACSVSTGRMSLEVKSLPRSPLRPVGESDSPPSPACNSLFVTKLHKTQGHCCVCLFRLSPSEREQFEATGRSLRVTMTHGGCEDCKIFPHQPEFDEEPVRLCRQCFFSTHKQHQSYKPFS